MSIKVTLGEKEYSVPRMNIGQIEDMSVLDRADAKWTFKALGILMQRADPKIESIRDVEAEPSQIASAITTIMKGSGYELADPNPKAPEATPGQGGN